MNGSSSSERGRKAGRMGRKAEHRAFDLFFDWGWEARKDIPDEGFDFNVEVPAQGSSPTHRFLVQVKGSEDITVRSDGSWSVPVTKKRMAEYQSHRLPVFVIAYDKATDSFRWCDTDRAGFVAPSRVQDAKSKAGQKERAESGSVYLRLVAGQALSVDLDAAFACAVDEAWQRRNDRHHGPAVAVAVRQALLEKLDPRFQVEIDVIEGAEKRKIFARGESVELSVHIQFANLESAEAMRNNYRFGVPVVVQTESFRIEGSPLFESMAVAGELHLSTAPRRMHILLGYRQETENSSSMRWLIDEEGSMYGGVDGGEWFLDAPTLPLVFRLKLDKVAGFITLSYEFREEIWQGTEYRRLPYVAALSELFTGVLRAGKIGMAFRHEGEICELGEAPFGPHADVIKPLAYWLKCMEAIKTVCAWAQSGVVFDGVATLTHQQSREWVQAAMLINGRETRATIDSMTVTDEEPFRKLLKAKGTLLVRNAFSLSIGPALVASVPFLVAWDGYAVKRLPKKHAIVLSSSPRRKP